MKAVATSSPAAPRSTPAAALVAAHERLRDRVDALRFGGKVAHVYDPLDYAWPIARTYLRQYGAGKKEVVLLGMNPGPFGMGQTGVPFGEVAAVRDYLKLSGEVTPPKRFHEKRPVLGLASTRSEVSGARLWGAIAARYPEPKTFFARAFVLNYCPLLFLDEGGANLTPDKLVPAERRALEEICDQALAEMLQILDPEHVVGIGQYAAKRASLVTTVPVVTMPHPSPASPLANRGWAEAARAALTEAGVDLL